MSRQQTLTFNFATPEIARSLFRDAGSLALHFAMLNRALSISRCRNTPARSWSLTLNVAMPENARSLLIARSQFCNATNHLLSILRRQKSLTLNFAMPEIARTLFCDNRNCSLSILRCQKSLALSFASPVIARSQFRDARNRSIFFPRCWKLLALHLTSPKIARSLFRDAGNYWLQFCDAGPLALNIVVVPDIALYFASKEITRSLFFVPKIARSQVRDARNRSLSISRRSKLLALNFATPENASSQCC